LLEKAGIDLENSPINTTYCKVMHLHSSTVLFHTPYLGCFASSCYDRVVLKCFL